MSKIEVNKIGPQCGTTLTVGCGAGQTVAVDANTVTIGRCGGTVALASGASQTGFGRTGTVDWQTSIKTAASFTAVNGEGYFVDTSSNAVTANLPAGSAGAIVSFKDYAQNFDTNALTIAANGSEKIDGQTFDLVLGTEGAAVTLVYGDATKGWQAVNSNEITNIQKFVTATGGTVTTVCTNFKVHTFTGPGTFSVSCGGTVTGSNTVDYLVIAGGGAGGGGTGTCDGAGGGGGAGGYRESPGAASGCYSVSPLGAAPAVALPVTSQCYSITIGAGGTISPSGTGAVGGSGGNSTFSTITSAGGGGAGSASPPAKNGVAGGSGGGASGPGGTGGAGNTPPVNPAQGKAGGISSGCLTAGGGGATAVGFDGVFPTGSAGNGGTGATSSINGTPTVRAGGGGGGIVGPGPGSPAFTRGIGGPGGGGNGQYNACVGAPPNTGTTNSGSGGGGGGCAGANGGAGNGGSGIVIIRYKFQ